MPHALLLVLTLLAAAHKDYRIGPDLLQSLPIGGVDGRYTPRPSTGLSCAAV